MKRVFFSLYAIGAVVVIASPAEAGAQRAWRTIYRDAKVTAALDTTRVRISDEGSYMVFVRWDYATPRRAENRRSYTRMVQQVQVKCSPIRVKRLSAVLSNAAGQTIEEMAPPTRREMLFMNWDALRPETEGARVYPMVCQSLTRRPART